MTKKTLASVLAIFIVSSGGWYAYFASKKENARPILPTETDAVAVFTGTVRSTIQGVGTVTTSSTQTLQFNSNGKIVAWNVAPGNHVKKGQVLAEVDSRDVDNDIRNATLSLKNAELSYEKLFSSVKDSQIASAEASIAQAERSIASAPAEIENLEMERVAKVSDQRASIAQTERSVELAREKLAILESDVSYVKASSEDTVAKSGTDLAYILSSASISADNQLSDARSFVREMESSVLNLDEPNAVPYEFSAKDASKGTAALGSFEAFRGKIPSYAASLDSADFSSTGGVLAFLSEREAFASLGIASADALSRALEASLPVGNLPQSTINSLASTAASYRSKFTSVLSDAASVRKQIAALEDPALVRQSADNTVANKNQSILEQRSSIASLESTLASQRAALSKLESDYEIKIRQKRESVLSLEESLKTARLNLQDLKDGPTDTEIASAKNQIEQAKISLEKTRKKKEDFQIIAGFDGIVTASNGKVGEISTNSNSSDAAATSVTVEIPGLYEISVLVDQLDVVKVRAGQKTEIAFDSYPGQSFLGKVSEVDPTPVTSQGVVSYRAKILFQSDELRIYNSMTANVAIVTEERQDATLVPTVAISADSEGKKTVRIWKNGRSVVREVETGLSEGANTEILSGVTIGDRVATAAFNLSKTNGNSGFSLFNLGRRSSSTSSGSRNGTSSSSSSQRSAPSGGEMGPPPGM